MVVEFWEAGKESGEGVCRFLKETVEGSLERSGKPIETTLL